MQRGIDTFAKNQVPHSRGLFEYADTKVEEIPFVMVSAGEDGKKGKQEQEGIFDGSTAFAGSDDVISW